MSPLQGKGMEKEREEASAPSQVSVAAPTALPNVESGNVTAQAPRSSLPTEKPKILEVIDEASVSYDAAELPKIQPFLLHADPEVRKAALEGMLTLGDAAAAPMLRTAAKLALTPEEAQAMTEAAAYLELPSGSMLKMKPKKK